MKFWLILKWFFLQFSLFILVDELQGKQVIPQLEMLWMMSNDWLYRE